MSTHLSEEGPGGRLERHCLVTVGATARFTQLLTEIIQKPFLDALCDTGFTHLNVQCGKDIDWFRGMLRSLPSRPDLYISPFDFVDDLVPEMVKCRAEAGKRRDGVVVCHAGTGTILDGLRVHATLVVVPNPTLKDNHQDELAEEIQNQGYAIWGRLGQIDHALGQSELLCDKNARTTFRPHPVRRSGSDLAERPADVDIWRVTAALINHSSGQGRPGAPVAGVVPASEVEREESTQMALD